MSMLLMLKEGGSLGIDTIGNLPIDEDIDLLPDAGVTASSTTVLTNKSIDSDNNTITNIVNADIKAAAAIDATKIADGTVSNTEFQYLNGVTSAIQTQIDTKASVGLVLALGG